MKIMHLIGSSFFGGPEKQIIEHLKCLKSDHYQVYVASFLEGGKENNEFLERAKENNIQNFSIKMSNPIDVCALWAIIRILKNEGIELLCVHGYKSVVMGWLAGKFRGIPVLAFSRGYTTENKKVAFYEQLERITLAKVDGVVCVSHGQKQRLDSFGVNYKNSWVVHNATVLNMTKNINYQDARNELLAKFMIPEDSLIVISVGRLSPEKGHRYLIEAISLIKDLERKAVFLICGDGQCRHELEAQASSLGISHLCRFVGFIKDMEIIYTATDLLVLPSRTEGLPNVVLEAFAHSKAVVSTSVGGVPELVENNLNGILVESERPDLLSIAIKDCLENSEKREQMGSHGFHTVKSSFTFELQTERLSAIYEQLAKTKASSFVI